MIYIFELKEEKSNEVICFGIRIEYIGEYEHCQPVF